MINSHKSLQNPDQYGLGNDYEQDLTYVVELDENGKSTYRDGIYTKLAHDVKDPEGLNKRTVAVPQDAWEEVPEKIHSAMSGWADNDKIYSDSYATGSAFGYPFGETPADYAEKGATYVADFDALVEAEGVDNDPTPVSDREKKKEEEKA